MKKIKIKNKWSEVTLSDFIKIAEIEDKYTVRPEEGEPYVKYTLQRDAEIVALLSGETFDTIMDLPHDNAVQALSTIKFLQKDPPKRRNKKFVINGVTYGWVENFTTLNMGEKVSVEQSMMDALEENRSYLPDLIGILVRPYIDGKIEKFNTDTLEERKKLFMNNLTADKFINEVNFILATVKKSTPSMT